MNTNDLRNQIKPLLDQLSRTIEDEMAAAADQSENPILYLLQVADSNRSQWSGGYTFSNMVEQETREIALKLARRAGYQLQRRRNND